MRMVSIKRFIHYKKDIMSLPEGAIIKLITERLCTHIDNYVNYFHNSKAYLSFLFINGIITIEFFASGIRHQLPFLCSLPTPAIR